MTCHKIILGHLNFCRKIYLMINLRTLSVNPGPWCTGTGSNRLPLLPTRPVIRSEHHCPFDSTKLSCLVTWGQCGCEQFAQNYYMTTVIPHPQPVGCKSIFLTTNPASSECKICSAQAKTHYLTFLLQMMVGRLWLAQCWWRILKMHCQD